MPRLTNTDTDKDINTHKQTHTHTHTYAHMHIQKGEGNDIASHLAKLAEIHRLDVEAQLQKKARGIQVCLILICVYLIVSVMVCVYTCVFES